ncbi:hypothetical protein [Bosea sp. ASV33]|nr:hypothetical protein [Bosea sp. ASV33]
MAQRIADRSIDLLSLSDTHRAEVPMPVDELKNLSLIHISEPTRL